MTLEEVMVRRGLTPDTLAAAMDVPREMVVGWLCHRRRMHRNRYGRLMTVLGIDGKGLRDLLPDLTRKL